MQGGGERIDAYGVLGIKDIDSSPPTFNYRLEGRTYDVRDGSHADINVSEYRDDIQETAACDGPIARLVDSFAPQLSKDAQLRDICEAIILQMVSTPHKDIADRPSYRCDWHILLLGDPGTAKSELLQEAEKVAPRCKFKSGKGGYDRRSRAR